MNAQRLAWLTVASALTHLAVLSLLALKPPRLSKESVPPPAFDVQIVPPIYLPQRAVSPPPRPLSAQPIRPRRSLGPHEQSEVAPLVTPNAPSPATPPTAWALPPPAAGSGRPDAALRGALRGGPGGCASPNLLNRDERAACQERFGRGAGQAPFIPPPIAADKQGEWDKAAARKRAKWREREGTVAAPVPGGPSSPSQAPNPFPEVWTPHN